MPKAIICVLDSFGIGASADAEVFGDTGSDTLGHIAKACAEGQANKEGVRSGPLSLPNMDRLGLGAAARASTGKQVPGLDFKGEPEALWGYAKEISKGKDTPSGHWEIAGVPVLFDWGYFSELENSFPQELLDQIYAANDFDDALCLAHGSGTEVIAKFGEEHVKTGKPIFYTSADSVFQIAAHEEAFGLDRLLKLCEFVREIIEPYNIGRVIARPFIGNAEQGFERTANRRDYSVLPPAPTVLDHLKDADRQVIAVGKISDIYAHQGITKLFKGAGNDQLFDRALEAVDLAKEGDLVFANFVDFDMLYGHRRDVVGYAAALEHFDRRLPELMDKMNEGDLLLLTADHGCDPTWQGTDHTREHVPVLTYVKGKPGRNIGERETFADMGASIAAFLNVKQSEHGSSYL
ncbi:phosphopentomutase [Polycladidibacter stylochi]|uniref:phosphopentomutase n=1 Tax=Polycladidibacter stylochi TaxID=1807766 RepID=UPI0008379C8E|nr:phosphopentomutase [Pseudovibrio stylochi]